MENFDLRKYLAENRLLKENKIAQAIRDEAEQEDSKVGAAIFKRYAKKIESASKEDYRKILTSMERELIDTHPDTFDGDDDIVASFMALAENKLLKEDQTDLFVKAGFSFDDGLLGGVGSGGGGYYDFISDKISGYHIDKFDEEEFNNWYNNFSKKEFNSLVYDSKLMGDYGIDPSGLPKGIHQLDTAGAGEVMDDMITIYAYPTLSDEDGGEFITIFSMDKDGNIVPEISKEEVKAKLASNEYSII